MKNNPFFKKVEVKEEPKKDKNLVWNILSDLNTFQINKYNGKKKKDTQKLYSEEEVKLSGLSYFLLLQFIKNEPKLINVAVYLNENHKIKIYDMYLFVYFTFMYAEIGGVNWIAGKGNPKHPDDIKVIMKHYRIDYMTAWKYLDIMDNKSLLEIRKIYDEKAK